MQVDASWISGVRLFTEKRKGPIYELTLKTNWQGRYKAAEVRDAEGELVGRVAPRRALLRDGGAIELASGARLRVRVLERFTHDELEVRVDGREPVWRPAKAARADTLIPLLRKAGFAGLAAASFTALIAAVCLITQGSVTISRGFEGKDFILFGVGAVCAFATYAMVREAIDLLRGPRSRVARALDSDPSPIGWVHGSVDGASAFDRVAREGTMSLSVYFLDRSNVSFGVPARQWEPLLALFAERAPDAVFGYSDEAASRYADLCKRAAMRR